MEETQPVSAGDTTSITIEFLRRFPALVERTDEQLQRIVDKLNTEYIFTVSQLKATSRETLSAKLPGLVLDVLKPIQQSTQSESALRQEFREFKKLQSKSRQEFREEFRKFKKQILEKQRVESKACSYVEYYNDKLEEGRIEQWNPAESLDVDQLQLPDYLQLARDCTGSETNLVGPFWRDVLQTHKVIPPLQNGFQVAHLGTKIPDIGFYREGIAKPRAADFCCWGLQGKYLDWNVFFGVGTNDTLCSLPILGP